MEAAYFVMAILGCGEGDLPCQQVRMVESRYQSEAVCMAQTETALMNNTDIDYPVVVAQCRVAGEAAAELSPADVKLPDPEETPHFPRRSNAA